MTATVSAAPGGDGPGGAIASPAADDSASRVPPVPLVRVAASTDRGAVRPLNQDAAGACGWLLGAGTAGTIEAPLTRALCFCVADGVGGHPAGERASAIAVATIMARSEHVTDVDALGRLVVDVHHQLHDEMQRDRSVRGMGTTMAVLVVGVREVLIANVGDTRVYAYGDGRLIRLSIDDRLRAPDGSAWAGQSSALSQILGGYEREPAPAPHLERLAFEPGLTLLLCSDGVSEVLADQALEELLGAHSEIADAVRAILAAVLEAGAPDNVTAMLLQLDAGGVER